MMIPLYCRNEHIISGKTVNAMHIKTEGPLEGHKKGPREGKIRQAHWRGTNLERTGGAQDNPRPKGAK